MTPQQLLAQNVEFGNAGDVDTHGTGWFVGFSDWTKAAPANLRHVPTDERASGLCVKWFSHAAGDPNGEPKPLSEGRTMSMLVSPASEFRIEFSSDTGFTAADTLAHTLRRHGDFVIWGPAFFIARSGFSQRAC